MIDYQTREAERIRDVYRDYQHSPVRQAKENIHNAGNRAMFSEITAALGSVVGRMEFPLSDARVIDVGCGFAWVTQRLIHLGATPERCHGIDLLEGRLAEARRRNPGASFAVANACQLSLPDHTFDIAICSTLFSSILEEDVARMVAAEVARVLTSRGTVLWLDLRYPNPWNKHVRGYSLPRIRALFPGWRCDLRPVTVVPGLVRRLGRSAGRLYPLLSKADPLKVRYLGLLRKPLTNH